MLELLYPEGGYSAETGGKLANLRTLTNAQVRRYHAENYRPDNTDPNPNPNPNQVRRYHAENYRPDNTAFIVSGMVSEAAFLAALSQADAAVA